MVDGYRACWYAFVDLSMERSDSVNMINMAGLIETLRARNIPEVQIAAMQQDKISPDVIPHMSDKQLEKYIPIFGDRLFIRKYVDDKRTSNETPRQSETEKRKSSLAEKLKQRLLCSPQKSAVPKLGTDPIPNLFIAKFGKCRQVEFGLKCWSGGAYKQMKTASGGGTRIKSVPKTWTKDRLLIEATNIYFPGGNSKFKGPASSYKLKMLDFQDDAIPDTITVGEMYHHTAMRMLRFYLCIKLKTSDLDDLPLEASEDDKHADDKQVVWEDSFGEVQLTEVIPTVAVETVLQPATDDTDFISVQNSHHYFADEEHLDFNAPIVMDYSEKLEECSGGDGGKVPSIIHLNISRGHAFRQLNDYFMQNVVDVDYDVLRITIVGTNEKDELAEDSGGVLRDMLTEYWAEFYEGCTLGDHIKVPIPMHQIKAARWRAMAKILVIGYKLVGVFPVRIAAPFIKYCITGEHSVGDDELTEAFMKYVPDIERETLTRAMQDFDDVDIDELMDIMECRFVKTMPSKNNITRIVNEMAHKELLQQSAYIAEAWGPILRKSLVPSLPNGDVQNVFNTVIPEKRSVLKIIQYPDDMTEPQKTVASFLKMYIKTLDNETLGKFLRFCTGSDLMVSDRITVRFVRYELDIERRPVAHTCGCVLDLPYDYKDFVQFRKEFNGILQSGVWAMDIV